MSEERFQRIESKLDGAVADIAVLKTDVGVLKADVAVLKTDVAHIKTDVAGLKTDVAGLKTDVAGLKTDVAGLKTDVAGLKTDNVSLHVKFDGLSVKVDDLRREMHVLHEDTIDRIRAMDSTDLLRAEMRAGFAELKQVLANHAIPGEAADREFARTLDDHEQRIRTLERRAP